MKGQLSTTMFVKIAIVLMVFLVVSFWVYPKISQISRNINESIPRNVFDIKESSFEKIEQSFNAPMMNFYEAWWKYKIPDDTPVNTHKGVPVCVQELLPFGDFFKYYNLNMVISEEGEKDVVYYRISDFEDNKIASKYFDTTKDLCVIKHEAHRTSPHAIVAEDKILIPEELVITKNVKSFRKDSFTISVPRTDFYYDFDAEFEDRPLLYMEENYVCLVVGDDLDKDYNIPLPPCRRYSLEEVRDLIKNDIQACAGINQDDCGCQITMLDHKGLQMTIQNFDGYSNITLKNESDTLIPLKIDKYLFDFSGMEYKYDSAVPVRVNVDDYEAPNPVGKINFFPEFIFLGSDGEDYVVRNDFSGELSSYQEDLRIEDNKITLIKVKIPSNLPEEQVLSSTEDAESSEIKDKWNYFSIQNNINNALWCK